MIAVEKLQKSYNGVAIAKNISLTINKGDVIFIVGPSGEGKSVFIKMLIGLIKPDSGTIMIDSHPMHLLEDDDLCLAIQKIKIGMLFQNFALFDSMTIYENIELALKQSFRASKHMFDNDHSHTSHEIIISTLQSLGLLEQAFAYPDELSGGMQLRAALARLIAYDPNVIIYDEPTTGLDPATSQQVVNIIEKFHTSSKDKISIIITHDNKCITHNLSNRIFLHKGGELSAIQSLESFYCNN